MRRWAPAVYGVLAVEAGLVAWYAVTRNPFDFNVYMWGGHAVTHDSRLYLIQVTRHWFTYPPFAAMVFTPLSTLPGVTARVLWELGSIAAYGWACVITMRLAGWRVSRAAAAAVMAAGLALEPVWHTLFLGQVNLILLALVLTDVWRVSRGRPAGIGTGLAAAIKLTPAIFILMFLLTRKTRTALTAAATFMACGLAGYLVAPAASRLYWRHLFYDTHRVGSPYISNQSPYGAAVRILGGAGHVGAWYPLIPVVIGAAGLAVAAAAGQSGDWLTAAATTGTTGLLVSPISWTHHWVWIIPALAVLAARGGTASRVAAAGGYLLFLLAPMWWVPHARDLGFHTGLTLIANSYPAAALAFLAYAARRAYLASRATALACPDSRPALAPTLPDTLAVRVASFMSRRADRAALRPRQASDGFPAVSAAAIRRPPSMERFLRNWICWCARSCLSWVSQNRCPAKVVGTRVAARARADSRGHRPRASSEPAATWTAPLMRTACSVLSGIASTWSATGRTTGSASGATRSGRRKVS